MRINSTNDSVILSLVKRLSDVFYKKLPQSLIGSFFSGRIVFKNNGAFQALSEKIGYRKRISTPFKRFTAKSFDRSIIASGFTSFMHYLPLIQLRTVGLFLFSFGILTSVFSLISQGITGLTEHNSQLVFGIVSACVGGIFAFSQKSCYRAIRESKLASALLFGLIGIKADDRYLDKVSLAKGHIGIIIGIAAGLLGAILSPLRILAFIAILLLCYTVMCIPECGVVLIFLLTPVLPIEYSIYLNCLVIISYLVKLIRGKRTLKLGFIDVVILFFGAALLFGGALSITPSESLSIALSLLSMLGVYFVTVNTVKTAEWVKRCRSSVLFSFCIMLIAGLVQCSLMLIEDIGTIFSSELIQGNSSLMFSYNSPLTFICVALLPFLFTEALQKHSEGIKATFICLIAISLYCVVRGHSFGAIISILFGAVVVLLLTNKKAIGSIAVSVIVVPALISLLPKSVFEAVQGFFDMDLAGSASITATTEKLLRSVLAGGIGLGNAAFEKAYALYSPPGVTVPSTSPSLYSQLIISLGIPGLILFIAVIVTFIRRFFSYLSRSDGDGKALKHTALASFAGVASLSIMGISDDIFSSGSIFALFWLLISLAICSINAADAERQTQIVEGPCIELTVASPQAKTTKGRNKP